MEYFLGNPDNLRMYLWNWGCTSWITSWCMEEGWLVSEDHRQVMRSWCLMRVQCHLTMLGIHTCTQGPCSSWNFIREDRLERKHSYLPMMKNVTAGTMSLCRLTELSGSQEPWFFIKNILEASIERESPHTCLLMLRGEKGPQFRSLSGLRFELWGCEEVGV